MAELKKEEIIEDIIKAKLEIARNSLNFVIVKDDVDYTKFDKLLSIMDKLAPDKEAHVFILKENEISDITCFRFSILPKQEFIARVRHIGWICYQIACGQDYNEQPNVDQLKSLMQGVMFALQNPNATPEENHDNWMKMKESQGWKYGPIKDFEKKEHPDMVPFNELPEMEQKKDIMDSIANRLALELWESLEQQAHVSLGPKHPRNRELSDQ